MLSRIFLGKKSFSVCPICRQPSNLVMEFITELTVEDLGSFILYQGDYLRADFILVWKREWCSNFGIFFIKDTGNPTITLGLEDKVVTLKITSVRHRGKEVELLIL